MADIEAEIFVDDVGADDDSAYGDDTLSETTTLRSSILDYYYENGRRYHAYRQGQYWGPNDEQQSDQLDIGHHVYTLSLNGRLFLAPINENPQRVLDVGTGTGIWAIDFADQFPSAEVIGTDLSPIQPTEVPPNLHFEIDDCTLEWLFTKESFDFIHARSLYGSISDWSFFYDQVLKHLKPGGYFEQAEMSVVPKSDDDTVAPGDKPGSIFHKWGEVSLQAGDAFGKSLRTVDEAKQYMIDAGFQNVTETRFKWPIGDWPKDRRLKQLGLYNRLQWEEGIEGWCTYLLINYLNWKKEEVDIYLAHMRRALRDKSIHAYHEMTVVYGQKPVKHEPEDP